jgi:hypothetical protein
MGRGRFRPRTIPIIIAGLAILLSHVAADRKHLRRSRVVTVAPVNRRSTPMQDIRVLFPGGEQRIDRLSPGEEAECRFATSTDVTASVEGEGSRAVWGGVRGGRRPPVTYSD